MSMFENEEKGKLKLNILNKVTKLDKGIGKLDQELIKCMSDCDFDLLAKF